VNWAAANKKEIEQVFLLTRVMYKAVFGLHYKRQAQKNQGSLLFFEALCALVMLASLRTTKPLAFWWTLSKRVFGLKHGSGEFVVSASVGS
jgi:hypothetical protein